MHHPSETDILAAFSRSSDEGGRLLFERYYKPLVLFSAFFLNDHSSAEDVVQDVFYNFIRNRTYRQIMAEALTAYLFRCVKNACLNCLRDRRFFFDVELLEAQAVEEEAMTFSPELISAICEAIASLPEKTRLVVTAVMVQGKKYKEAAVELNISVNTVKTLLSHGLKQLRSQFSDFQLLFFWIRYR